MFSLSPGKRRDSGLQFYFLRLVRTEVKVVLSLQTRQRGVLGVEGVTVTGLEQPVDSLLPAPGVEVTGQVVERIVPASLRRGVSVLRLSCYLVEQLGEQYPHWSVM